MRQKQSHFSGSRAKIQRTVNTYSNYNVGDTIIRINTTFSQVFMWEEVKYLDKSWDRKKLKCKQSWSLVQNDTNVSLMSFYLHSSTWADIWRLSNGQDGGIRNFMISVWSPSSSMQPGNDSNMVSIDQSQLSRLWLHAGKRHVWTGRIPYHTLMENKHVTFFL